MAKDYREKKTMTTEVFFVEGLKAAVEKELNEHSESYVSIEIRDVKKANGLHLTGMVFCDKASNLMPTIYVDGYYEEYVDGRKTIGDIAKAIVALYLEGRVSGNYDISAITDWEKAKEHIFVRLRSASMNKEQLQECPHRCVLDLALMYYVRLDDGSVCGVDGAGTVLINNEILNHYGVDFETLDKVAWENTKKKDAYSAMSLFERLVAEMPGFADDAPAEVFENASNGIYVLSNQSTTEGAVYMVDTDVLSEISEKLGGRNFVVLPSSIHEALLIPYVSEAELEDCDFSGMVRDVNNTQVAPPEILSYSVYKFNAAKKEISVC